MTGAVHLNERVRTDATSEAWGERELNAGQLDAGVAPDGQSWEGHDAARCEGHGRMRS